jgi:UDP-N-acetylglucosamine--N-acetylmuramyl-(pentapeptide) pyrophosphoryl-undecaprenol N-acetylglucosamine transferase
MRVLIAGGGTGGHLFPGIAVAEEVLSRGGEVLFVGTARGIEARVLPELGLDLETIRVGGLAGVSWAQRLRFGVEGPLAAAQSIGILRRFRPHVVAGVGGYSSGPVVMTAALGFIPTVILEQNSVPGITNRLLGRVVRRVFGAFEESRQYFSGHKMTLPGNPVRRAIVDSLQAETHPATTRANGPMRVFAFGGSQGARFLNECLMEAAPLLATASVDLVHQTGEADHDRVCRAYAEAGLDAEVHPFISDMAARYAWTDLIVSRAGATTLAELAIVGRPAVLIPFPFATHNHQERNAREFEEAGAALCRPQMGLDGAGLADLIGQLAQDEPRRSRMAEAMGRLARPRAAADIVDQMEVLVSRRRRS